jgi:hypothetical protein
MRIDNPPPLAAGPRGPLARKEKGGWGDLNVIFIDLFIPDWYIQNTTEAIRQHLLTG